MHLRHLIVLIIDVRNWRPLLYNSATNITDLNEVLETTPHGVAFDRSDQKTRIHVVTLLSPGL
jgi:hypothetical protein